ncbi:MAG: hypothetical protein V9E85_05535 [Candidatus Nanopelagicales bacterium]
MKLYVDGERRGLAMPRSRHGTGLQRLLASRWRQPDGSWPNQPTSAYFAGTIDEVAVYDCSADARIRSMSHWSLSLAWGPPPPNVSANRSVHIGVRIVLAAIVRRHYVV